MEKKSKGTKKAASTKRKKKEWTIETTRSAALAFLDAVHEKDPGARYIFGCINVADQGMVSAGNGSLDDITRILVAMAKQKCIFKDAILAACATIFVDAARARGEKRLVFSCDIPLEEETSEEDGDEEDEYDEDEYDEGEEE